MRVEINYSGGAGDSANALHYRHRHNGGNLRGLKHHALAHLLYLLGGAEAAGYGESELACSRGALGGDEVGVLFYECTGIGGSLELILKARIACGLVAAEQSEAAKAHGACADGAAQAAASGLGSECVLHSQVVGQSGGTGHATRHYERVGLSKVHFIEKGLGYHGNAVGAFNDYLIGHADRGDFLAASAQYVDGGEGFNFFEAVGKEYVNQGVESLEVYDFTKFKVCGWLG